MLTLLFNQRKKTAPQPHSGGGALSARIYLPTPPQPITIRARPLSAPSSVAARVQAAPLAPIRIRLVASESRVLGRVVTGQPATVRVSLVSARSVARGHIAPLPAATISARLTSKPSTVEACAIADRSELFEEALLLGLDIDIYEAALLS